MRGYLGVTSLLKLSVLTVIESFLESEFSDQSFESFDFLVTFRNESFKAFVVLFIKVLQGSFHLWRNTQSTHLILFTFS